MVEICRFAAPFIQSCLFDSLTLDLIGDRMSGMAVDPLDDLADVFEGTTLNLTSVTIALFVPLDDASVLASLSKEAIYDGIVVTVVAIGWT